MPTIGYYRNCEYLQIIKPNAPCCRTRRGDWLFPPERREREGRRFKSGGGRRSRLCFLSALLLLLSLPRCPRVLCSRFLSSPRENVLFSLSAERKERKSRAFWTRERAVDWRRMRETKGASTEQEKGDDQTFHCSRLCHPPARPSLATPVPFLLRRELQARFSGHDATERFEIARFELGSCRRGIDDFFSQPSPPPTAAAAV